MHFEFLSDPKSMGIALAVVAALWMLAAGFVYPGPYARRLSTLRLAVLILFFIAAISLTIVYRKAPSHSTDLYILLDRSVSMEQKDIRPRENVSREKMARDIFEQLKDAARKDKMEVLPIYFADAASDAPQQVGDRRMTKYAPALSLLLEKLSASPSHPSRVVLISDGAAADEPSLDPYLSALMARGVALSVWPVGPAIGKEAIGDTARELSPPGLFFKIPPPPSATAGESVPLDIGLISASSCELAILDGSGVISEYHLNARANSAGSLQSLPSSFCLNTPGLRTVRVRAKNEAGTAELRFRIKILPQLAFELVGRPCWDARYFLVAAGSRPQISIKNRWGTTAGVAAPRSSTDASRVQVSFDPGMENENILTDRSTGMSKERPRAPIIYWPQGDMPQGAISSRGIHWLGRVNGSFTPAFVAEGAQSSNKLPPISARQKISLDLGWKVLERYTDGEIFIAEQEDTNMPPALLINGEGLWRWWMNPLLLPAARGARGAAPAAYARILEHVISWAWKSTAPPVELFALQDIGQIGAPVEIVALFSSLPGNAPALKVIQPDGKTLDVYGAGTTAVRYSFVPPIEGSYRAALGGSAGTAESSLSFQVSDIPFDVSHPEARPETLRRIAARTGGRVLTDLAVNAKMAGPASAILTALDVQNGFSASIEENRVAVSRNPVFFIALAVLFTLLWAFESRWLR